jgi:Carbonic anhydrase
MGGFGIEFVTLIFPKRIAARISDLNCYSVPFASLAITRNPSQISFMKLVHNLTPIVIATFPSIGGTLAAADHAVPSLGADAALAKLKAGNARFVSRSVSAGKPTAERRAATAKTQHPFAIIVGCADSRTSPELVFDQNIGDLFVIRTAGNLVDDYALGSIEYAVAHLGTRLILDEGSMAHISQCSYCAQSPRLNDIVRVPIRVNQMC